MKRALLICLSIAAPACASASGELPVVDAHSQYDDATPVDALLQAAASAGVNRILLSARRRVDPGQLAELAARHPDCIVASARTKGSAFAENRAACYRMLDDELARPEFHAMSEILLVHAPKGRRAAEVLLPANAPQVQEAIRRALERSWPVVLHYELRWLGEARGPDARAARIAEIENLLAQHAPHPFALIHMAQLDASDAARLLLAHANLVFLTSHANPIATSDSRQPWTNMFAGDELAPQWKALMLRYPDRFVLALDNVWYTDWSDLDARQAALWRSALGKLPPEVAQAVAHGNAERLWKLPPAIAGQGCAAMAQH